MKNLFLLLILLQGLKGISQEISITSGMKINRSVKFVSGNYRLNAPADTSASLIEISGNNIVVDFNNAELKGSNEVKDPDQFYGIAIYIRNSRKVTIRNLKARGFKIALLARNVDELVLDNCDLSYNYRQHLNSTQEKEDISDWMSYHHNEKDEWLRYGAAFYLRGCNKATIRNCRVTGGQNALMMMECNDAKIYNNDFSFNSGIGLGMYRCNRNQVSFNRMNFNVRGHSEGVYNRGQDSAGMLVYEQSSDNIFYRNSVTHSGDGFFLWAGQTTMDTGKGGCNDNLLWENDFSFAPTNGVEVTFSRNYIVGNRIIGCDHGIWGGYSYESRIENNKFGNNRIGIAIEHGQHNLIIDNLFMKDKMAIKLWSNPSQPANWGYAKYRDTRSVDYVIARNSFNSSGADMDIKGTDSVRLFDNVFNNVHSLVDSMRVEIKDRKWVAPRVPRPMDPFKGNGKRKGRENIRMLEWGPYDYRSPLMWNTSPADSAGWMRFDLLGPKGQWKIVQAKGVDSFTRMEGDFPSHVLAKKIKAERTDIQIDLEFVGDSVVTALGELVMPGTVYPFHFRKFFQPMNWHVEFFELDTAKHNPLSSGALFANGMVPTPFKRDTVNKLDYAWWGGIKAGGKQYTGFITVANASASFEPGEYEISLTWDDAARLLIDGKTVIDEWTPSKYDFDESPNRKIRLRLGGEHRFRLEHVELGGFATISLKIIKLRS
jgi:parallel beta-helix repeat protein